MSHKRKRNGHCRYLSEVRDLAVLRQCLDERTEVDMADAVRC